MKKVLAVLNFLVILIMIGANGFAGANEINGNTIASLSDKYFNLFTPADYAFSIWGLIFLALLIHGIWQLRLAFGKTDNDTTITAIGPWLILANVFNVSWIFAWLYEQTLWSVMIMALLLFSLIRIVIRLNMEKYDADFKTIAFTWWPISIYVGWIAVATVANISAYLAQIGWSAAFSEQAWTVIMMLVASLIYAFMIYSRNMRESGLVGVWALLAISFRHWDSMPVLQWTALLLASSLLAYISIHGYQRRKSHPFWKLAQS